MHNGEVSIRMMEAMLIERHENLQTEDPPNAQARRHGSQQDLEEKLALHMADNRQARRYAFRGRDRAH